MNKSLKDALTSSYAARARFFYTQIDGARWRKLRDKIKALSPLERGSYAKPTGASERSWQAAQNSNQDPALVFCYPEVIEKDPDLVEYYRLAAAISQKGLSQLLKEEKHTPTAISLVLNGIISDLVESIPDEFLGKMEDVALAELGTEVQGGWVNKIGVGTAKLVREMILEYAMGRGYIKSELKGKGKRGIYVKLANNWSIIFADEPDVSIRDDNDTLQSAIEIKGSMDVAGAQTRYGEAKKSFGKALKENPRCETVYLCSCLTPAVARQIEEDGQVRKTFILPEILSDEKKRQQFLEELFKYIIRI
ncbi:XcyI family restriction endonuclease [bacterium]|nr:XcyI family restriction endonuclease [bacterium]